MAIIWSQPAVFWRYLRGDILCWLGLRSADSRSIAFVALVDFDIALVIDAAIFIQAWLF